MLDVRNVRKRFANNDNLLVVDSYVVVNLRTGLADWRPGNWELEPFVGLDNLKDESYSAEIRSNNFGGRHYQPAPDLHFCGGLSIRYNYSQGQP